MNFIPILGCMKFFFKMYVTFTHHTTDGAINEVHENLLAYICNIDAFQDTCNRKLKKHITW